MKPDLERALGALRKAIHATDDLYLPPLALDAIEAIDRALLREHAEPDHAEAMARSDRAADEQRRKWVEEHAEPGRRQGHSKLVYNKVTRTIDKIDPYPAAPGPVDGANIWDRGKRPWTFAQWIQWANDNGATLTMNQMLDDWKLSENRRAAPAVSADAPIWICDSCGSEGSEKWAREHAKTKAGHALFIPEYSASDMAPAAKESER